MDEVVAAADPLQDFAVMQGFQPADETQGELPFFPEAETEEVIFEDGVGSKGIKT